MPEFAPQRFSSKKPRRHRKWPTKGPGFCLAICLVICLNMVVMSGCDDGEPYERDEALVAEEHAQARASYLAQQIVVESRDWVLLHPSSERQRQSRRLLLEMEGLDRPQGESEEESP